MGRTEPTLSADRLTERIETLQAMFEPFFAAAQCSGEHGNEAFASPKFAMALGQFERFLGTATEANSEIWKGLE